MLVMLMKRKTKEKVHRIRHADSRASALYCTRPVSLTLYRSVPVYANVNLIIDGVFPLTRSSELTGLFTLVNRIHVAPSGHETLSFAFVIPSLGAVNINPVQMINLFLTFPCSFQLAFANPTISVSGRSLPSRVWHELLIRRSAWHSLDVLVRPHVRGT
jgi:hypothetical protein